MSLNSSQFAQSSSQNVSNFARKIITFKPIGLSVIHFSKALEKFRPESFYIILKCADQYAVIGLDRSILNAWLGSEVMQIGDKEFQALKESTAPLIAEFQNHFQSSNDQKWSPIRWETSPNFLSVFTADKSVNLYEFNIHILRQTGKLWVAI